jgi:hypothetical protein
LTAIRGKGLPGNPESLPQAEAVLDSRSAALRAIGNDIATDQPDLVSLTYRCSWVVPLSALPHNPGESFGMLPLDSRLSARIMTERTLNMDEISFHPLSPADAGEAARVVRAAFAAQPRLTDPPSSALKETAGTVAAKIAAGGGRGAFASGALVGAILWEIKAGALRVGRVSVVPTWRGGGVAALPAR